jgi:hypothetical protein
VRRNGEEKGEGDPDYVIIWISNAKHSTEREIIRRIQINGRSNDTRRADEAK